MKDILARSENMDYVGVERECQGIDWHNIRSMGYTPEEELSLLVHGHNSGNDRKADTVGFCEHITGALLDSASNDFDRSVIKRFFW